MDNHKDSILQSFDAIPNFPYGAWRERIENNTEDALISMVRGKHRCKYFNQPLSNITDNDGSLSHSDLWWWNLRDEDPKEYVTKGTQTDYRESETQTDPWDPPYKVSDSSQSPEILLIASMKYGEGLPVTSKELEHIIHEREQNQLKLSLPPVSTDQRKTKKRNKIMAELKFKEVEYLKSKLADARVRKTTEMSKLLKEEVRQREERKNNILTNVFSIKAAEWKEKSQKIREKLSRDLRKIDTKRSILTNTVDMSAIACDDVEHHSISDPALVPMQKLHTSTSQPSDLNSLKGLVDLENWLLMEQKFVMEPEIYGPKKEARPSNLRKMIELTEQKALDKKIMKPSSVRKEIHFAREKAQALPMTPTVFNVPQEVLDRESSTIVLQKLFRGRALQKEVLEVCDMYGQFIEEYWKTNAICEEEQIVLDNRLKEDMSGYLEALNKSDMVAAREEILSRFEGTVISEELNVLAKTVDRYTAWQNVEQLVLKAKEERRLREAEEGGRRQKEILQQQAFEKQFMEMEFWSK